MLGGGDGVWVTAYAFGITSLELSRMACMCNGVMACAVNHRRTVVDAEYALNTSVLIFFPFTMLVDWRQK